MRRLLTYLARKLRREDGTATIEFVILFPFFIGIFTSAFEASLVSSRQIMLDRATEIAVRDLRLGITSTPTNDQLKADICNLAGIIPDCTNKLHIELEVVDKTTWAIRTGAVQCVDVDQNIIPAVNYSGGSQNDLMLVTVCAVFEPMVSTWGLGLLMPKVNGGSYYALVSMSAFVNEPV